MTCAYIPAEVTVWRHQRLYPRYNTMDEKISLFLTAELNEWILNPKRKGFTAWLSVVNVPIPEPSAAGLDKNCELLVSKRFTQVLLAWKHSPVVRNSILNRNFQDSYITFCQCSFVFSLPVQWIEGCLKGRTMSWKAVASHQKFVGILLQTR